MCRLNILSIYLFFLIPVFGKLFTNIFALKCIDKRFEIEIFVHILVDILMYLIKVRGLT